VVETLARERCVGNALVVQPLWIIVTIRGTLVLSSQLAECQCYHLNETEERRADIIWWDNRILGRFGIIGTRLRLSKNKWKKG
jgi:hypothetical protein